MDDNKNVCDGCVYLKKNKKIKNKYSCQHEAFSYIQLEMSMYIQTAKSAALIEGKNVMPHPNYSMYAKRCRSLPEVQIKMEKGYYDNGLNSFPYRFSPIQVKSCKGKILTVDLYGNNEDK